MSDRLVCTGPSCERKRRSNGLCEAHRAQRLRGEPLRVIQLPMESWEFNEEVVFLLDMKMSTGEILATLGTTWDALRVRLHRSAEYQDTLDRLSMTLAREQGRDAEAA